MGVKRAAGTAYNPGAPGPQTTRLSSPRQVYTRLHLVSSNPGAETGHVRRFRVCVRLERLPALPHVGRVCREPAEAELGAGALHHRVSYHEVGVTSFLFHGLVFCICSSLRCSPPRLHSCMFLLVLTTAYLEAQSIWEPFKKRVSVESNSSLETGRPFNLREIVQNHSDSKYVVFILYLFIFPHIIQCRNQQYWGGSFWTPLILFILNLNYCYVKYLVN